MSKSLADEIAGECLAVIPEGAVTVKDLIERGMTRDTAQKKLFARYQSGELTRAKRGLEMYYWRKGKG